MSLQQNLLRFGKAATANGHAGTTDAQIWDIDGTPDNGDQCAPVKGQRLVYVVDNDGNRRQGSPHGESNVCMHLLRQYFFFVPVKKVN
jgi:hypothetical protein